MPLSNKKLAILGAGNMGRAILRGLLKSGSLPAERLSATSRDPDAARLLADSGVSLTDDNRAAVAEADIIVLSVKPQAVGAVAAEIRETLSPDKLLISILAGVTTSRLEELFGADLPVVRAMPNIPARVDEGATAICAGSNSDDKHMDSAEAVFNAVGETVRLREGLMDAVTGLSGSGPAYIYMVIEALTDGGVQMGIPRDTALKLATQTVLGSAKLVKETNLHPAILRDPVTTPGGTTIHAVHDLEQRGLRAMLASAVVTATERSQALNLLAGKED